jgi:hypothetical protein
VGRKDKGRGLGQSPTGAQMKSARRAGASSKAGVGNTRQMGRLCPEPVAALQPIHSNTPPTSPRVAACLSTSAPPYTLPCLPNARSLSVEHVLPVDATRVTVSSVPPTAHITTTRRRLSPRVAAATLSRNAGSRSVACMARDAMTRRFTLSQVASPAVGRYSGALTAPAAWQSA